MISLHGRAVKADEPSTVMLSGRWRRISRLFTPRLRGTGNRAGRRRVLSENWALSRFMLYRSRKIRTRTSQRWIIPTRRTRRHSHCALQSGKGEGCGYRSGNRPGCRQAGCLCKGHQDRRVRGLYRKYVPVC